MSWHCFNLLSPSDELDLPGALVSEKCHDKCREATNRAYETEYGTIILTEWRSRTHRSTRRCSCPSPPLRTGLAATALIALIRPHLEFKLHAFTPDIYSDYESGNHSRIEATMKCYHRLTLTAALALTVTLCTGVAMMPAMQPDK